MSAGKAIASHGEANRAANDALEAGGNAVDAAIAGFFALAAAEPGALLSPLAILWGGVGQAPRTIDGRAAQPGLSLARPRGLRGDDAPPPGALAAAPRSLAALAVAHAYSGSLAFGALVRPAAALAKSLGALRRAELLRAVASQGATALVHADVLRALLAAGGPQAGGALSEVDLRAPVPSDVRVPFVTLPSGLLAALPATHEDAPTATRRAGEAVVAADPNGLVAALACCPDPEGVLVPELEVGLARDAVPVRRGVPRVRPGTTLGRSLPLALLRHEGAAWLAAVGACGRADLQATDVAVHATLPELLLGLVASHRGAIALAATATRGARSTKTQVSRVTSGSP